MNNVCRHPLGRGISLMYDTNLLNKSISNLDIEINDIKIGNRFRKDLGDLEPLKQSIRKIGLLHPAVINENNELVCGYRRLVSYEQLGYEEIPVRKINLQDIVNGEVHENTVRKDFTIVERYEIRKAFEPIEKQKAEQRMLAGKPSVKLTKGRVLDNISKLFGMSRNTLNKETEIVEAALQNPEKFGDLPERIDKGMGVNAAYIKIEAERKRTELRNQKPVINIPDNCQLLLGDFMQECKKIRDNSVDLILTDPAYGEKYLYLYEQLGVVANRVLKDGGSLVTFPNYKRLKSCNLIEKSGLEYHWQICVKLNGYHNKVPVRGTQIVVCWKSLDWFTKGDKTNVPVHISDLIESEAPDKSDHPWAQSTVEAEYIIKKLTVENQVVLDPMLGTGTNGEAALKLKRQFIGIEKDPNTYSIAQRRLSMLELEVYQK
jgi:ParB family chromosome partitioning protein